MKKKKNTIKRSRKLKRSFTNRKNKRTYRKMKRKSTKRRYSKRQQKGGASFMDKLHKLAYDTTPHGRETIDKISKDLVEDGGLVNLEEKGDEWYQGLESEKYPAYRIVLAKLDKDSSVPGDNHLDTFNRKLEEALKRKKEKESNWGSDTSNPVMLEVEKTAEKKAKDDEELKRLNKELDDLKLEVERNNELQAKQAEIDALKSGVVGPIVAQAVDEGSGEGSGKSEESGTTISNVNSNKVNFTVDGKGLNTSIDGKSGGGGKKKKNKKKKKSSKQKGG